MSSNERKHASMEEGIDVHKYGEHDDRVFRKRMHDKGRESDGMSDPFQSFHSIGTALQAMEDLERLKEIAKIDPAGVQQSLHLGDMDRKYSTEELLGVIQELLTKVLPGLVEDLEVLLASVATRYGASLPPLPMMTLSPIMTLQKPPPPMQLASIMPPPPMHLPDAILPEPLVPPVAALARETMIKTYGTPLAVVEKKMSNREYMSRFRLNTKFASALLPEYDHTTSSPTIYGALERLLLADITVCTVDGRAFQVIYELARTIKNDWLHHRFTTGWADVVRQLGIEIGDMLVFERWTDDRTLLTMRIIKECQLAREDPEYAWNRKPMTAAQRKGQF